MPPPYCYDHPRPAVTVDLAAFARDGDRLRVLLVKRKHDPFAGRWALPGGFLDIDEPLEAAARRELKEETGLDLDAPAAFLGVFGDPGRDPRGRTISVAYFAALPGPPPDPVGADDADDAAWHDPFEVHGLAFDHDTILAKARIMLAGKLIIGSDGLTFLPETFDDDDLRRLFRAVRYPDDRVAEWVERRAREGTIAPVPGEPGRYRARRGSSPAGDAG